MRGAPFRPSVRLRTEVEDKHLTPESPTATKPDASLLEHAVRVPLAGGWVSDSSEHFEVRSPFDGALIASVPVLSDKHVDDALAAATRAAPQVARMPAWERSERLGRIADRLSANAEELAKTIALEAGKPIREARGEASRAAYVFRWAAEEAKRLNGDWVPLDTEAGLGRRAAIVRRFPIGPVLAITPFNFPVTMPSHKVAPALAAGNPVLLKPATKTPLSALLLAEIVLEEDWPDGTLSVLPMEGSRTQQLARRDEIKGISFTGSDAIGWTLKAESPKKKVTLELGGNAAAIVEPDADIGHAARRLVFGSFAYAGQVCISTQRILIADSVYDSFVTQFVDAVDALKSGDPLDDTTDFGPMIGGSEVERISAWVEEAKQAGASVATGGVRDGCFYRPTVLTDVPASARCLVEEVFGPVVSLIRYSDFGEAIEMANATRHGLHAAVFTQNLGAITAAHELLDFGGIVVNDAPFFRAVQMPYGGVKDSGYGREGIGWAMREMSEPRTLILPLEER